MISEEQLQNLPITVTMTVGEGNLILKALGNLPYNQVAEVVSKIINQSNPQINTQVAELSSEKAEEATDMAVPTTEG